MKYPFIPQPIHQHWQKFRKSPLILIGLIGLWSIGLGWGLSSLDQSALSLTALKSLDRVPEEHQLGESLYRETCGSCHLALPPAVMPTETWRQLLQDSQHYGVRVKPLLNPGRLLVWDYILFSSRPLLKDESTPYRLINSRYFKALHPGIKFPPPLGVKQCLSCHPGATQFNFRGLTAEWE